MGVGILCSSGEGWGGRSVGTSVCKFIHLYSQGPVVIQHRLNNWQCCSWLEDRTSWPHPSACAMIAYSCKVNGGKHSQNRKCRHSSKGCFLILSLNWTLGSPGFPNVSFSIQHILVFGVEVMMYLNWDVVLKKRTIIVILSIRKIKKCSCWVPGTVFGSTATPLLVLLMDLEMKSHLCCCLVCVPVTSDILAQHLGYPSPSQKPAQRMTFPGSGFSLQWHSRCCLRERGRLVFIN